MFKDKLRQLRIDKGLTQADVAKSIGVSAATIGNYEQGTREPRSNEIWKKLADYFDVSIDYLVDKESSMPSQKIVKSGESSKKKISPFKTDRPIIYDGVDITKLVLHKYDEEEFSASSDQMLSYSEFTNRSGHVIFARKNLLRILEDIKKSSVEDISQNIDIIVEMINTNIVYWYKRCWNNINDLFPTANSLDTLYDLLDKCLCVDMIAEQEFSLIPIDTNYDWLREKLR